jgi:hypothetical protein
MIGRIERFPFFLTCSEQVRGYLRVLSSYLLEAAAGPREGHGKRTALWGLQRPPIDGTKTLIRADASTPFDDIAPVLLPFAITNARDQALVSVDPGNAAVAKSLGGLPVGVVVESQAAFEARVKAENPWNVIYPKPCEFALVGHFVSLLFPLGHIKCTRGGDRQFVDYFKASDKWLRVLTN